MGTEKTPLVQKLILGVLTLILMCLVVLIAQNWWREKRLANAANKVPPVGVDAEREQPSSSSADTPVRFVPVAVRSQADASPTTSEPETTATPVAPPQMVTPQAAAAHTALVNPVGRAPVEIVVKPDAAVLKTELCGRVRLDGKPPREIPISLDATCRQLHEGPLTTRHYVVGRDGGLANVLVYIKEGLPAGYAAPPTNKPVLRAQGCLYEPYVIAVQTGQKFVVQNMDGVLHNFHGNAKNNREFNLAIGQRGRIAEKSFDNPEVFIRFKCDVHPWEFSYMGVVAHPFFSVTDTNGIFRLPKGLPHGRYVLAAAHPKAGETLQEIVIQDENPNLIELAFTVKR